MVMTARMTNPVTIAPMTFCPVAIITNATATPGIKPGFSISNFEGVRFCPESMIAFLMGSLAFRVGSGSFDSIEHEGLKIAPCVGGMHMSAESASELIDQRIEEFGDWRGALLMHIREMIKAAVP